MYWDALTPILARETGATIVAYDRAGYGESDLPRGAPRPQLRELPPEPGQLPNLKALDWPLTDWRECRQKLSSGPI